MAKMLIVASSLQSEGHSLDSVMEAIRREPPPNVGIGEDHVVHRGRAYLTRDFRSLPVSDDMFESIRLFAWESLSSCFAWFLQHGYSPHEAQVEAAMQRILLMSTAKLRGVR